MQCDLFNLESISKHLNFDVIITIELTLQDENTWKRKMSLYIIHNEDCILLLVLRDYREYFENCN